MGKKKGIIIFLRNLVKLNSIKKRAQIATFIVLFIAIIVLLTAVLINIGRVASKKLSVINASSGSSIQLASSLGSYAHMVSCKYLSCKDKKCKFSWKIIIYIVIGVILIIVGAILMPAVGQGTYLLWIAFGACLGAIIGGALLVVMAGLQFAVYDPRMLGAMNRAFRKMAPKTQICESAIRYAFMNMVDDQVKVEDVNDLDQDGESLVTTGRKADGSPRDLISRFYYKYQQRLLWLADAGPGPDGTQSNYWARLTQIINNFLPALRTFNTKAYALSQYIGVLPTEDNPQAGAPPFSDPRRINSLYSLFAYLQEREYPPLDSNHYGNAELYHLSYHLDSGGRIVNIWTRGIIECPDEDYLDLEGEDPNQPCWHTPMNDELDFMGYSLDNFDHPDNPSDLTGFVGFAPAIINEESSSRVAGFEDSWYSELYDESSYEDYYDQVWQMQDVANTEYLVENGWDRIIGNWLTRLNSIRSDIVARRRALDLLFEYVEYQRLGRLLSKVDEARTKLTSFKNSIPAFRNAIIRLRDAFNALSNVGPGAGEDYLLYNKTAPTYVWNDSLGRHSVQVVVSNFNLPKLKSYRKGCCTMCVKLQNKSGTVWIRVVRKDDPTNAQLPGNVLFWKFRYPVISYTAFANYNYKAAPPEFLGVQRN